MLRQCPNLVFPVDEGKSRRKARGVSIQKSGQNLGVLRSLEKIHRSTQSAEDKFPGVKLIIATNSAVLTFPSVAIFP